MTKIKKKNQEVKYVNYAVFVIPIIIIFILFVFMIIQYLGERFDLLPTISLNLKGFTIGESVILFIFSLSISIFIALTLIFFIFKLLNRK